MADFPYDEYSKKYKELTGDVITDEVAKEIVSELFRYAEIETEISDAWKEIETTIFGKEIQIEVTDNFCKDNEGDIEETILKQPICPTAAYRISQTECNGVDAYLEQALDISYMPENCDNMEKWISEIKSNIITKAEMNNFDDIEGLKNFLYGGENSNVTVASIEYIDNVATHMDGMENVKIDLWEWFNPDYEGGNNGQK